MVLDGSLPPSPTPLDLEMLDSNATEQRPSLPTSLSDFALFPTSSSAPSSPSAMTPEDGLSPFFRRLRRSSLLASNPITADIDIKSSSPLAASFVPRSHRFSFDSEKMTDDSSSTSPSTTPSLLFGNATVSSGTPATPPRSTTSPTLGVDLLEPPTRLHPRRISLPPKPARLLDLRNEVRSPIESELKSEAQFQRLIASYSYTGFPLGKNLPHTPRAWANRGRYPEEAGGDDEGSQGAESASDDGDEDVNTSANASMSMTPSGSGEDQAMTIDTAIVGAFMMDIDAPSSTSAVSSPTQWRQTPPPSGVRPNKRKFDDRYDPYPSAAKRRAVSPSVHPHAHSHAHSHHSHSHSHPHSHSHSHPHSHSHSHAHHHRSGSISHTHPASPISIPMPRTARSVTSSPIMHPASSPVMRPTSFPGQSPVHKGIASPTIRPIARLPPLATLRGGSDGDRERNQRGVDGAGEAVGSLSIA